jgi:bacterioferritin
VALGGTPTTRPAEVELARTNREILEILLQAEKDTIARYTERVQQAEAAGEIGLRVDLEDLVSDETRHKEDLERILLNWRD